MISRSNITENEVKKGIAPCVNVTRTFFFKKSCKSIIPPYMFDAPSVLLEMHLETSIFCFCKISFNKLHRSTPVAE